MDPPGTTIGGGELMSILDETLSWFSQPGIWTEPGGILQRLLEHLGITLGVVAIAAGIALPLGILIGHRRRGAGVIVIVAGAARAIPTLGLLTVVALSVGIGLGAPVIALLALAAPPLLAGAYSGIAAVNFETVDAARAIGMSERQLITSVELPLATTVIVGGLRSATLQVVATATLAAYTADAGLGRFIFAGLKSREYGEMTGGSLLAIALALILDGIFALILRLVARRPARDSRLHLTERSAQ